MTHNQFESSIRFIYKGVPRFIRLSYETFLTVENELHRALTEAYKTNPDAVNSLIATTFRSGEFDMLALVDRLFNDAESVNLRNFILTSTSSKVDSFSETNIPGDDWRNPRYRGVDEDRFNSVDFGDIVAPVMLIEACITALVGNRGDFPAMAFELIQDYNTDSQFVNPYDFKEKSGYDRFMNPSIIRNSMGQTNVFDQLQSILRIDVNNLFSKFFCNPMHSCTNGEFKTLEAYDALHSAFRDEKVSASIIDTVTKASLASAISTYLVYAGKLCGSKKDIYDWMYASFVRNSVEELDKGIYPTSVDISTITGHTVSDKTGSARTPGANNMNNKAEIDNDIARKGIFGDKDDSYSKNLMYKHIRLLYSNWAAVINMITQISCRRTALDTVYTSDNGTDGGNSNVNTKKESVGRSDTKYIQLAEHVLFTYIKARFTTYNTAAQYTGTAFLSNVEFIKISKARILDSCVKSIIEECCLKKGESDRRAITDFFIPNTDKVQGILAANELTKNMLADLFMMCAYLSMLTYAHDHSSSILDQSDPVTGKNNRELFEDIYFSLKRRIHDVINACTPRGAIRALLNGSGRITDSNSRNEWNDGYKDYSEAIRSAFVAIYDYTSDFYELREGGCDVARIVSRVADSTFKLETSDVIPKIINSDDYNCEAFDVQRILTDLFIIPPITAFVSVKLKLEYINDTSVNGGVGSDPLVPKDIFTRSTSLFPKNKVTVSACTQTEFIPSRIFSSVEAAEETLNMMDGATDPESTWAHMGYNEIGAIGGAVRDLEDVTCPPTDTSDSTIQMGSQISEECPPVESTDGEDERKIIGAESYEEKVRNDTQVMCVESISNRFGRLFSKVILKK